ncbi:single-stranded DNA-binding protein [Streptomyces sp. DSM 42041]|uniref:Single-stranded DNA-binding protein n=1 Tax=Streptomyces hazeniae TaxID=3075538 RepID=A0ABU2NK03_9ACTN|nr:single-stranded DNA-binding protein [Streptomyces sp. DSM 42041]MDT0377307.1 single-stranded DNA-binding protein [Streptomyces sp. DSM 42041]
MALPSIHGVARLVDDPELRFTPSGVAVAAVRLVFNSRKRNPQTQEWEDGDVFWIRGTAWRQLAENVAGTLSKGMEVHVAGELRTESWEQDGDKRQATALNIRAIGPNLAYASARVEKNPRKTDTSTGGGQAGNGWNTGGQPPPEDPWATGPGGYSDEPPF